MIRVVEPAALVTVTVLAPGEPSGVTAVILVGESIVNSVTGTEPIKTALTVEKLEPVMVMLVPPTIGPDDGEMVVMVGCATKLKAPDLVPMPPAVVTCTSARPAVAAGVLASILVGDTATTFWATTPPIFRMVAPGTNPVPKITIGVLPAVGPSAGVMDAIVGVGW